MGLSDAEYRAAAERLVSATSVAVCAHIRPDGDAVASTLALAAALRACGVDAVPTLADEDGRAPATYAFLPWFDEYVPAGDLDAPEVLVALDTPNVERLGAAGRLAAGAVDVIVLDHHPDNLGFGTMNLVDTEAAAVGQMVWRLLAHLGDLRGLSVDERLAHSLYVALLTDTGGFRYSNTTPQALRDAADMVQAGADPAAASREAYEERSHGAVALAGLALSRLQLLNGGRVAHAWIADEDFAATGALPEETEHLVDMLRMLGGVDVVVFAQQRGAECRVNLRSKNGFDVGSVARRFGGGGHAAAAGLTYAGLREDFLAEALPLLPGAGG
ncbi:MAG: bifunctional oligoribonuclease/PAP phosphatase NrnA [Actinobacteria bacterium]|nr:MAG: bifunctional oligoribonuclease/PAP phosphatase NrnA [Actinomycetota bacterium]